MIKLTFSHPKYIHFSKPKYYAINKYFGKPKRHKTFKIFILFCFATFFQDLSRIEELHESWARLNRHLLHRAQNLQRRGEDLRGLGRPSRYEKSSIKNVDENWETFILQKCFNFNSLKYMCWGSYFLEVWRFYVLILSPRWVDLIR